MKININSLVIYTVNDVIRYSFNESITFIYGNIGVGKTSLVSILMFCFGNDLVETPAIIDQFISAECKLSISGKDFNFRREFRSSTIFAHYGKNVQSIDKRDITQFIFSVAGISPIYFDRQGVDTPNQLTLKNFFWYSYLEQSDIDNNFFYLNKKSNEFYQIASMNVLASLLGKASFLEEKDKRKLSETRKRLAKFKNGVEALNYVLGNLDEIIIEDSLVAKNKKEQLVNNMDYSATNEFKPQIDQIDSELNYLNILITILQRRNKFVMEYTKLIKILEMDKAGKNFGFDTELEKSFDDLGQIFKRCLLSIGFPSISEADNVSFSVTSFAPLITNDFTNAKNSFDLLGSGGKKTLFKICFLLAVHMKAHTLPFVQNRLPSLIIIDTPMKNISEREDKVLFENFYEYLLELSKTTLSHTQFILVDKEKNTIINDQNATIHMMTKEQPLFPEFIDI